MNLLTRHWKRLVGAYADRYQPEGIRVLAYFYWYALLSVAVFVVLTVFTYGYFQFSAVKSGSNSQASVVSEGAMKPPLTREELEKTLQSFEERRTKYESLKSNPPQIADPSR